ncbi:helix-turn-helix domain-containing protein [Bacillus sp. AFS015802]|uniref:helix-turn-helix domain-containing protein n=1 Tax=Bacillus sp. AFS015802 TaxID=2033486 RepID=UPI00211D99D1|nr:helix-turn-helix domain-containing protein [Bacillus sp. AFS015802]
MVPKGIVGPLCVRGVLVYLCHECSRVSALTDGKAAACPSCLSKDLTQIADGALTYNQVEEKKETIPESPEQPSETVIMTAEDVAQCLGISRRVAYEVMERRDFPLLRIGRLKKVNKYDFEEWLKSQRNILKET